MRSLKTLVIGMAVLILVGVTVLAVTIVRRAGDLPESAQPAEPARALPGGFDARRVTIPAGAKLVASHGAGGRLIVRLELADGTARFLVLDPANGRLLGRLDFAPE